MKKTFFIVLLAAFSIIPLSTLSAEASINKIFISEHPGNITPAETLRSYLVIHENQVFQTVGELMSAVGEQKQLLQNTRYFSSLNIETEPSGPDGGYNVLIDYTDGFTFAPLPYPIPDSSVGINGWSFGLKITYDNFFGTMTDFLLDGSMDFALGEENKLKGWEIELNWDSIRLGDSIITVKYLQTFKTTEVTDPTAPEGYRLLQHYTNHQSDLKTSVDFSLDSLWTYTLSPGMVFKYLYDYHPVFEGSLVQENSGVVEDRATFVLSDSIGFENVDWIGPLRNGLAFDLTNNIYLLYSFDNQSDAGNLRLSADFDLSGRWYKDFGDIFYYYTKLNALIILNNYQAELGDRLRGVKVSSMYGDLGLFWQNSLGIELFGNDSFHLQLHPFIDAGIVFYTKEPRPVQDLFRIGFGTEGVFMLGSINLIGRLGYDPVSDYFDIGFSTDFMY